MNNRCRILVVDDDPVNLQVVASALKHEYDIITAQSGHDAVNRLKEQAPDLLLLDVMMPDLNGFELCRMLKSDESFAEIPVIFLTALDSTDGEIQGLEFGGIDYLTKPINFDLLKLRVRNHLALKLQRDQLARQKAELEAALARVKQLEGIIPICMHCKSIREGVVWQQLEKYITEHTDALFSHGICPKCMAEHYPDVTH